jgi:hypothetical protein
VDLSLPSILASTLVGSIGFVLFHYGRKCTRMPQLVSGLTLMLFPMFVPGVAWMLGIAAVILAAFWACLRAGL